ncbi:MAG TPA: hypothetical protein PKE33_12290 [Kiritimatiellia bacterium]|nr:hypothetical protein [Kiritimatiellia bacterium]
MEHLQIALTIVIAVALIVGYCALLVYLPPLFRIPIVLFTVFVAFKVGDRLGRASELTDIGAGYGRFVTMSYWEIDRHIDEGNINTAALITEGLKTNFAIAPSDKRQEHLQLLNQILDTQK